MNTNPQQHTSPRWRRQEGRNEGGCILGLIIIGLFILCSVIGQIRGCIVRNQMAVENENAAERQRADNLAANLRAEEQRRAEEKRQQAKQQVLNYALGLAKSPPPARLTQPYIKGKQVVLTGDTTEDYSTKRKVTNYSLKDSEADSLDQVGTVVVLHYNDVASGDYVSRTTGAIQTGYRRDCEVTIIDSSIPAVIYKKTMRGTNPGQHVTVYNYGTIRGDPPDVEGFLKSLPRR
jgi:hypothetical protein